MDDSTQVVAVLPAVGVDSPADVIDAVFTEVRGQDSEISEKPPAAPRLTAEQRRERQALREALDGDVREDALWELASAGTPINVAALAGRMGIEPSQLSFHLGKLRNQGLVFPEKRGKETWYHADAARVRYERIEQTGRASLTLTARGGGVAVTITVGANSAANRCRDDFI